MILFPPWHRQALEDDGYLVFEPGSKEEQAIAMRLELAKSGRQVFLDTDLTGIADYLRGRHACVVLRQGEPRYTVESATAFLVNNGLHVFRASSVPVPRVGECWIPTRGEGKRGLLPRSRWVRAVGNVEMTYARTEVSLPILITMRSWVRWVQKTRARCV